MSSDRDTPASMKIVFSWQYPNTDNINPIINSDSSDENYAGDH